MNATWPAPVTTSACAVWDWRRPHSKPVVLRGDHQGPVHALAFAADGHHLASAGDDGAVRVWDPASGATERVLQGHTTGSVRAVCAVRVGGQELLASAGNDRAVRLWDPRLATSQLVIPTVVPALAVTPFDGSSVFVGLQTGVLAIRAYDYDRL